MPEGQQYHLNCDECGDLFWTPEAFPKPQICPRCQALKARDEELEGYAQSIEDILANTPLELPAVVRYALENLALEIRIPRSGPRCIDPKFRTPGVPPPARRTSEQIARGALQDIERAANEMTVYEDPALVMVRIAGEALDKIGRRDSAPAGEEDAG